MSSPRRPNDFLAERIVLTLEHPQVTADTTQSLFKARRAFVVESVRYVNDTGLAADAANFYDINIMNGATLVADWSTETGQDGTIAAATFVDLDMSAVDGALHMDADDVLSLVLDETGAAALPAGRFQVEGRYI